MSGQVMEFNADSMNLDTLNKIVKMCSNSDYYHEFNISGCIKNDRHSILKALLDFVNPISFIAVAFIAVGNTECKFLATNCLEFMLKIIANKFRVPLPDGSGMLMINIKANFIPSMYINIDQVKDISSNLQKRIDSTSGTINLNNFCEDETLLFYYPLYDSRTMLDLTCFLASYQPKKLLLQNNCLKDANYIHLLKKTDLVHLDLRNNQISSLQDLQFLKHFSNLKHLLLDGNPICQLYNSYNYVLDIKGICKSLEKLDNIEVNPVPAFHKNFFCNEEGEDLGGQFLEHFFTVYDSNRSALSHLYDKYAIVSVGSKIRDFQITSETANLFHYGLKKPFMVVGKNVRKLWDELPETIHDPYTFVCDVTSCNEKYGSISVNGIFRERNQILFFSRNFLLKRRKDEFSIINDQLFVTNPTDIQIGYSFRFPRPNSLYPYFGDQYKGMDNVLSYITGMNSSVCRAMLDMCGYDLKKSLEYFEEDVKNDDVPREAYTPDSLTHNDSQNNAYSSEIVKKTKEAFSTVNAKTVWETYNKQRLNESLRTTPIRIDFTIDRIYPKITLKNKIHEPSSKAFAVSDERKPIQKHLKGSTIPQTEQSKPANSQNISTSLVPTLKNKPGISRWIVNPNVDSESNSTNTSSKNREVVDITNRVARNLRLKKLTNQIEKEYSLSVISTDSKQIEKEQCSSMTLASNTTISKEKQDPSKSTVISSTKPASTPVVTTPVTHITTKEEAQALVYRMFPPPSIPPLQQQGLGVIPQDLLSAQAPSKSTVTSSTKPASTPEVTTPVTHITTKEEAQALVYRMFPPPPIPPLQQHGLGIIPQDLLSAHAPSNSTVTSSTKPASTPVVTTPVVTTPVTHITTKEEAQALVYRMFPPPPIPQQHGLSTVSSSTKPASTPVVGTPTQLPKKGQPVPRKKKKKQTHITTKAEAQALAYRMFPPPPISPLQQHLIRGLGMIPHDLLSARAQTMMSMHRQPSSHNFIHPNWQPLTANMGALGIPEVPNMMAHHGNMLNVPNKFTIPDDILEVPEILRMQAELFNSSPPIANEGHLAPYIFNIDDFEPPKFSPSEKPVAAKTSQQAPKRQVVIPPPGVDMVEYLTVLNVETDLKRKGDEQNGPLPKQRKLSSDERAAGNQNIKSCTDSGATQQQAAETDLKRKGEEQNGPLPKQRKLSSDERAAANQNIKSCTDSGATEQQAAETDLKRKGEEQNVSFPKQGNLPSGEGAADDQNIKSCTDSGATEQQAAETDLKRKGEEQNVSFPKQGNLPSGEGAADDQNIKSCTDSGATEQQAAETDLKRKGEEQNVSFPKQGNLPSGEGAADDQNIKSCTDSGATEQQAAETDLKRKGEEQNVPFPKQENLPSGEGAADDQNIKSCTDSGATEQQAAETDLKRKGEEQNVPFPKQGNLPSGEGAADDQNIKSCTDSGATEQQAAETDLKRKGEEQNVPFPKQGNLPSGEGAADDQNIKSCTDSGATEQQAAETDLKRKGEEQNVPFPKQGNLPSGEGAADDQNIKSCTDSGATEQQAAETDLKRKGEEQNVPFPKQGNLPSAEGAADDQNIKLCTESGATQQQAAETDLKRKGEEQNVPFPKQGNLPSGEGAADDQNIKLCTESGATQQQAANANKGRKEVDSEPNNKTNVQETIDLKKEDPSPSTSDVHSEVGEVS